MVNEFRISATSDKFWNLFGFVEFLFQHQGSAITLLIDPEAVCLTNLGVYNLLESLKFQDVTIITRNPLEYHPIYKIHLVDNQWLGNQSMINTALHSWNQKKIFYALFGRPTAGRLGLASYLLEKYSKMSHIHFSATTDADNLVQFEFDKLLEYDIESVCRSGNLLTKLPLLLAPSDRYTAVNGYDYSDPLTDYYQDILVDVVVETHVLGNTFFPTEKTLRSIWMKKPFIVFASQNYLCYLRQMGFKTFWQFWDEDYDGYETRGRITKIFNLLDWFAGLNKNQLQVLYRDITPILEHNYALLSNQLYNRVITKID